MTLDKVIMIGDRLLIRPKTPDERTHNGLYLPQGVKDREEVQSGYIVKAGPGYLVSNSSEDHEESWKSSDDKTKYLPLQVKVGDLAIFLRKGAIEVDYQSEKLLIVPQQSILMVERDEDFVAEN